MRSRLTLCVVMISAAMAAAAVAANSAQIGGAPAPQLEYPRPTRRTSRQSSRRTARSATVPEKPARSRC